jgi:hypothetical protein
MGCSNGRFVQGSGESISASPASIQDSVSPSVQTLDAANSNRKVFLCMRTGRAIRPWNSAIGFSLRCGPKI